VLLDILSDVLLELVPTPRRVERWVFLHPTPFSMIVGGFTFAGFTVAAWTAGQGPIPWTLTSGLGVGIAVVVRLALAFRAYGEKRQMSVNGEIYRVKHGPDSRRLGPEKPLPRLFEPADASRTPKGTRARRSPDQTTTYESAGRSGVGPHLPHGVSECGGSQLEDGLVFP
jgi:hypothetical protein